MVSLLRHAFYAAIQSIKLLTDPALEGDPYIVGHPSEQRIELNLKSKPWGMRRRMMFRI